VLGDLGHVQQAAPLRRLEGEEQNVSTHSEDERVTHTPNQLGTTAGGWREKREGVTPSEEHHHQNHTHTHTEREEPELQNVQRNVGSTQIIKRESLFVR